MRTKEVGELFGYLTLLELLPDRDKFGHKRWRCLCKCGNECITTTSHLRDNSSCGCRAKTNLVGNRYGRLTVIERLGVGKNRFRLYRCLCDCGTERITTASNLNGGTQSCGCLARERGCEKLPHGESAFRTLLATYKLSAKRRGLEFALSYDEFKRLTQQSCHYCARKPYQVYRPSGRNNGGYVYSGVDRMDPDAGYNVANCVPCCGVCNKMKLTLCYNDFIAQIRAIYLNLND